LWPLLKRAIFETGASEVNIDGIGVGAGLIGEARNAKSRDEIPPDVRIHNFKASEKAQDERNYHNRRAELWWRTARLDMAEGRWDLSQMEDADTTIGQLQSVRWFPSMGGAKSGRIQVEEKRDIIARLGHSPDEAEAFLMAAYQGSSPTQDYFDAMLAGRLR
jgi:hypothetical protein